MLSAGETQSITVRGAKNATLLQSVWRRLSEGVQVLALERTLDWCIS
jgi:hypothetical protein